MIIGFGQSETQVNGGIQPTPEIPFDLFQSNHLVHWVCDAIIQWATTQVPWTQFGTVDLSIDPLTL